MTRAKKILVTAAMVAGVAAGAAAPAMADQHATTAPQDSHATIVSPLDSHAS
ncbi:hypothetical protein ACFW9D_11635 [Streptomyces sp. NPDC059524]|uniref:hypothetical protein n=1 Tax=Streptomyces sp. NPDC059524 TaxID=3346856 RepID=UPI00367EA46D